jgi:hypothetical protein
VLCVFWVVLDLIFSFWFDRVLPIPKISFLCSTHNLRSPQSSVLMFPGAVLLFSQRWILIFVVISVLVFVGCVHGPISASACATRALICRCFFSWFSISCFDLLARASTDVAVVLRFGACSSAPARPQFIQLILLAAVAVRWGSCARYWFSFGPVRECCRSTRSGQALWFSSRFPVAGQIRFSLPG